MSEQDKIVKKLNPKVAVLKQHYLDLIGVLPYEVWSAVSEKPKAIQDTCFQISYSLLRGLDAVDDLLSQIVLGNDSPVLNVPGTQWNFYEQTLLPKREEIGNLFFVSMGLGDLQIDVPNLEYSAPSTELLKLFSFAINRCDTIIDEHEICSEENLRAAQKIISSTIFRPDTWIANLEGLKPIFSFSAEANIPRLVHRRLKEIYDSYIVGHYSSVIALSRSVLEYVLLDQSKILKIQIYHLSRNTKGQLVPGAEKKLGDLVNEAAERIPDMEDHLRSIKRFGDKILHPKEEHKVTELPIVSPSEAIRALSSLREIVKYLYTRI